MARKQKRTGKGKQSKLIIILAAVIGIAIIAGMVVIGILISSSGDDQGSPYENMSEDEKREAATAYVEAELDAWRAGRESELCSPLVQPILVQYDIVEVTPSDERDDGINRDAFEFTVQLTFTNEAGGRPVILHRYLVRRSASDGEWEIRENTKYFH
ncbi:MAG: hypothetical protein AAGC72_03855 [Planctomycetota bacterium]